MKKHSQSPRGRPNKNERENPEGLSILLKKKSNTKLDSSTNESPPKKSPSHAQPKSAKKKRAVQQDTASFESEMEHVAVRSPKKSPTKRKGPAGDSTSFLEQTPESLSQISSIMPPDDSSMMTSYLHSPSKKRRQQHANATDTTMELAVRRARGEPDGADESMHVKKSPKKKGARALPDIAETEVELEESPGKAHDKENTTMMVQKTKCMQLPLKQAGKKLKSMKTLNGKNKVSTKVKRNFDKTLPDETLVPKKPKLTWKEKKKERKMVRNNYDLIQSAKGLWEELRRQKLTDDRRQALCKNLYGKVQGKVKELAVVHDSARIIQCLVQYGGPEFRTAVIDELKSHVAELSKNKYGKFIIRKMLKYGYIWMACDCLGPRGDDRFGCRDAWEAYCMMKNKKSTVTSFRENRFNNLFQAAASLHYHRADIQDCLSNFMSRRSKAQRAAIITGFHGCVRKLIRHREASDIINYAYNDFASASQRLFLLEEFYGPAFTMFRTHSTRSLDDIMLEQPDKRDMIMNNLKESLLPLIDKQILTLPMVHKIFLDFFKYSDSKLQKDMTEALRESLVHMVHTREGARVAMGCVWSGSAKDRKVLVKSLKGHVIKMCKEETGHMVLLSVFDSVDDTVLVQKVILDEIIKGIGELMMDVHGRKVLTYLLVRRDHGFFCPDITQILQQGDDNPTSKKDPEVRAQELRDYVSDALLNYLTDNAIDLLSNSHTSLIIPLILNHASGNTGAAMDALANTVVASSDPSYTGDSKDGERKLSLVEDPAAHITLKKILACDRDLMHQGKDALFSMALLNAADASTYKAWVASNRGCFILITLFEVENAQVTQMLLTQLAPLKKYLKKMTFKGAEILLKKLEGEQGMKSSKKPLEISL